MRPGANKKYIEIILGVIGIACILGAGVAWGAIPTGGGEFSYSFADLDAWFWNEMRGFTVQQAADHAIRLFLLAPGLLCLTYVLAGRFRDANVVAAAFVDGRNVARVAAVASLFACASLMLGVFRGTPIITDEMVYRMQADLLAEGRVGYDPAMMGWPREAFIVESRVGATGKYLPGEPVVQILGVHFGIPALAHLLCLLVLCVAVFRAVSLLEDDDAAAGWAVAAVALSPWIVCTAATGQSEVTALTGLALALWGTAEAWKGSMWRAVVCVVIGVTVAVWTRPQDGVPVGGVLAVAGLVGTVRRRAWWAFGGMSVGLGTSAVGVVGYCRMLTGRWFVLPWALGPKEAYGFGQVFDMRPYEHTVLRAVENLVTSVIRLNTWWLGVPAGFLVVWLWVRYGKVRWQVVVLVAIPVAVLFGYYSPGVSDTGPVYYMAVALPGAWIAGNALAGWLREKPGLAVTGIVVHAVIGVGSLYAMQVSRLQRLVQAIDSGARSVMEKLEGEGDILLMAETRCDEIRKVGWLDAAASGWPYSDRGRWPRVVVFPRFEEAGVRKRIREVFAERKCYYVRRPKGRDIEIYPCSEAEGLMRRTVEQPVRGCPRELSLAERLGWRRVNARKVRRKVEERYIGAQDVVLIVLGNVGVGRVAACGGEKQEKVGFGKFGVKGRVWCDVLIPNGASMLSVSTMVGGQGVGRGAVPRIGKKRKCWDGETVRVEGQSRQTVAGMFAKHGYHTVLISTDPAVGRGGNGIERGFEETIVARGRGVWSRAFVSSVLERFLKTRKRRGALFLVLYLGVAEEPFEVPPGRVVFGADRAVYPWRREGGGEESVIEEAYGGEGGRADVKSALEGLYEFGVGLANADLGRVIDLLKDAGLLEKRDVLIVTSDHGANFVGSGPFGAVQVLRQDIVKTFVLVRAPGVEAGRGERRVAAADIFATLVDAAGLEDAEVPRGSMSLLRPAIGSRVRWAYAVPECRLQKVSRGRFGNKYQIGVDVPGGWYVVEAQPEGPLTWREGRSPRVEVAREAERRLRVLMRRAVGADRGSARDSRDGAGTSEASAEVPVH